MLCLLGKIDMHASLDRYHKEGSLWKWGNGERSVRVWLQACWHGEWCDHSYGKEQLHQQNRTPRLLLCHTHHTGSSSFFFSLFKLSLSLFLCLVTLCFVCILWPLINVGENGSERVGVWGQKNYGRLGFRVQKHQLGSGVFSVF